MGCGNRVILFLLQKVGAAVIRGLIEVVGLFIGGSCFSTGRPTMLESLSQAFNTPSFVEGARQRMAGNIVDGLLSSE